MITWWMVQRFGNAGVYRQLGIIIVFNILRLSPLRLKAVVNQCSSRFNRYPTCSNIALSDTGLIGSFWLHVCVPV